MDYQLRFGLLLGLLCLPVSVGCKPKSPAAAKSASPAKVELLPHESELASITLTEDAHKRLGIEVVDFSLEKLQRRRTFGGEVMLPPGKIIQITAPIGGKLIDTSATPFPTSGMKVRAGQTLLVLSPLLSPERDVPTPVEQVQMAGAKATLVAAQVTAQGDMERSTADVAAAKITVDRTQKLLADRAGSQRAVDDAIAIYKVAEANLAAARNRYEELSRLVKSLELQSAGVQQATSLDIKAPLDGVIRTVNVSPKQPVVSGAAMFEVIDTSSIWIRVPIFVDLTSSLATESDALVVKLDGSTVSKPSSERFREVRAKPVAAPPSADPTTSSVDIYYEVSNADIELRPGQRVGMSIPVDQQVEAAVLPASAVLFDYHGGTWVYLQTAAHKFQRTRVNVLWYEDERVVIENRLAADVKVVTSGAAELFGTEFGPGK